MEITAGNKLLDLTKKTAIVTGAVGIGYGISYRLAEAGANVMVVSLGEKEVSETENKLTGNGWKATAVQADVSMEKDVKRLVKKTIQTYGSIDILVNNAGI